MGAGVSPADGCSDSPTVLLQTASVPTASQAGCGCCSCKWLSPVRTPSLFSASHTGTRSLVISGLSELPFPVSRTQSPASYQTSHFSGSVPPTYASVLHTSSLQVPTWMGTERCLSAVGSSPDKPHTVCPVHLSSYPVISSFLQGQVYPKVTPAPTFPCASQVPSCAALPSSGQPTLLALTRVSKARRWPWRPLRNGDKPGVEPPKPGALP